MPELPEVETLRRDLEKEVTGKRVKTVEVTGMRSIRRHPNKKHFIGKIEGKKIAGVQRKGKYLLMKLEGGDILVVHLGMSGQLLRSKGGAKDVAPKHTHRRVPDKLTVQLDTLKACCQDTERDDILIEAEATLPERPKKRGLNPSGTSFKLGPFPVQTRLESGLESAVILFKPLFRLLNSNLHYLILDPTGFLPRQVPLLLA